MLATISTFSKTFDEVGLIYFIPTFLEGEVKVGQIVEIPLREQIEIGVVIKLGNKDELGLDIDEEKIKSIVGIKNENIFLKTHTKEILPWISSNYFTPIHNSACLFFPKNLRDKITKDKLVFKEEELDYSYNFNKSLSEKQEEVFNKISNSNSNKILFHGVTGSGKTEIYIKLIKQQLDKGGQSLLLIPEIILTNQLSTRLEKVFGEDLIVLNSSVSEAKKTKHWLNIYSGEAKVILGTRSALFYPYDNLGLIIIDEEHDNSYTSSSSPRYKGIEVAEKLTEINGNKLVMGSGTPSITNMYRALKGELELVSLLEKYK